jgi:HD-GYP domain-containing protein (c-di-GMP phosphodiesterase class II)
VTELALRGMARAVDAKDAGTQDHSERVADLAHALALEAGWPPREAERLRSAGLVHDAGKLALPIDVL